MAHGDEEIFDTEPTEPAEGLACLDSSSDRPQVFSATILRTGCDPGGPMTPSVNSVGSVGSVGSVSNNPMPSGFGLTGYHDRVLPCAAREMV